MYKLVEKSTVYIDEPPYKVVEGHVLKYKEDEIKKVVDCYNLLITSYTKDILEKRVFECSVIVYQVDERNDMHFPYLTFKIDLK